MFRAVVVVGVLLSLTACQFQNRNKTEGRPSHPVFASGIYSLRPDTVQGSVFTIVKLKSAPLLANAVVDKSGHRAIEPQRAKELELEQKQFLNDLEKISKDIQVILRYRLVLNGFAIVVPTEHLDAVAKLENVKFVEKAGRFNRPKNEIIKLAVQVVDNDITLKNSVTHIQGHLAHQLGFKGQNMRVGVIDTGIDYTHSMLGGSGKVEDYTSTNPVTESVHFPNAKVVGGIDIVGTKFTGGSDNGLESLIPSPDLNPIDEAGHGTHVAGSIAGIGDNHKSYSGVAPDASLYAIKVFGADGGTRDEAVIAGLEFAADPNGDLSLKSQLDVVNLSLGSNYGDPHVLYSEAIKNLSNAGTVVVASAGNSGNQDYIVGAPGVTDDAISVAASIDSMDHNYKFNAVIFKSDKGETFKEELIEGAVTKSIANSTFSSGKLVYAGLADKDFTAELINDLKGNVALIDRGLVSFSDKIKRAQDAGAVAVVMVNNQPGDAFIMGGEKDNLFEIPGLMVTQALGLKIKQNMQSESVIVNFKSNEVIEKPETIDTIAGFSSKGPRSSDGALKPEIAAPGESIISAGMGKGNESVQMSGTSMAGPHIAGAMALIKQAHPNLSSYELKSILMAHAKVLKNAKGAKELMSRQGAGRVQVLTSIQSPLLASVHSFSLGLVPLSSQKVYRKKMTVKNISNGELNFSINSNGSTQLRVVPTENNVILKTGETKELVLDFHLSTMGLKQNVNELDALIEFVDNDGKVIYKIPVLAVVLKSSLVNVDQLLVQSSSEADSFEAAANLKLTNKSKNAAELFMFNFLDLDEAKNSDNPYMSSSCDLEGVGYRIVDRKTKSEQLEKVLQFGFKLHSTVTTWQRCEVNVLIDTNKDGIADIEVASLAPSPTEKASTLIIDINKLKQLKKNYAEDLITNPDAKLDLEKSVLDVRPIYLPSPSAIAITEILLSDLQNYQATKTENVQLKISTSHQDLSVVEMDDFSGQSQSGWIDLALNAEKQGFMNLNEVNLLNGATTSEFDLTKGSGDNKLMLLLPDNVGNVKDKVLKSDEQMKIIYPSYLGN